MVHLCVDCFNALVLWRVPCRQACYGRLYPVAEFFFDKCKRLMQTLQPFVPVDSQCTQAYSTEVESPHPYAPASYYRWDVECPPECNWMWLTFDPKCATTSDKDTLKVSVGGHVTEMGFGVKWPVKQLLLPGNTCTITLEVLLVRCCDAPFVHVSPRTCCCLLDSPRRMVLVVLSPNDSDSRLL